MKKIILMLLLLGGCAQTSKNNKVEFLAPDTAKKPLKVVKREFWQIFGAQDILRNTSEATLSIWIRQEGEQNSTQDLIGISVGSADVPTILSRASIRLHPKGRLHGIARAADNEPAQSIDTGSVIKPKTWHHIALVIDYANDSMKFYVDGNQVPATGKVAFRARKTSDTPSRTVVVGSEDDGSVRHFRGEFKDIGVWRRKLSEEEITTLAKKLKRGESLMIGL